MPIRRPPPAAFLAVFGLLAAGACAHASSLYKCDAADGSIAYVGKTAGFRNCRLISTFADPPRKVAAAAARVADRPAADRPETRPARRGWVYEENRADFSTVRSATTVAPAAIARADFRDASGGGASSARAVVPQDFSTVQADVASSGPTIGTPLFIAAPYRPPARAAAAPPVTAAAAAPPPRVLRGAVYKVERRDGITEYTNVRPPGGGFAVLFTYIATCIACDIHSKIDFARTALNLDAYRTEIAAAAADYGIDSSLLRAVIHAESAFNPMALSSKGAQGLMQLMPGTAGDLGVTDAFDAAQNIRGGARYLGELLKDFNGDAQLAAAAYSVGPGAVQKYHGIPPYDETQLYVQRVATLRDRYQKAL